MKSIGEYRVGTGASSILMILVALALAALALLSLTSARNNAALSQRSLEMTVAYYNAAADLQRTIARMDETIDEQGPVFSDPNFWQSLMIRTLGPDGTVADDLTFTLQEDAGADRALVVEGKISPDAEPNVTLTRHELVNQATTQDEPLNLLNP